MLSHNARMLCRAASCSASSSCQLDAPQADATSSQVSGVGLMVPGATSRIITSMRDNNFSASTIFAGTKEFGLERFQSNLQPGVEPDVAGELKHVHRKLEIDQPARPKLDVERARRRLVPLHLGAHPGRVARHLGGVAGHAEDALDHRCGAFPPRRRAEYGPSAAQGHMLPSPGLGPLIVFECFEGDGEHALGAFGPKAGVDVVEGARGGGDAERRRHPARQPVVIIVRPERLASVRLAARRARCEGR